MATNTKPVINTADLPLEYWSRGRLFESRDTSFGKHLGLAGLGISYSEVPPGKSGCPFHNHHVEDELFYVIEGTGEYRFGDQSYPIKKGDVLGAPAGGPETAHQIINTGSTPLVYLGLSTKAKTEICEYPDSGKFLARTNRDGNPFDHIGREKMRSITGTASPASDISNNPFQSSHVMIDIPILETGRLILRAHRLDDFEAHFALWRDEDVVRFIGGVPSSREQAWSRMLRLAGMWHHMGFGFFAIEEKQSGRFIGEAGFLEARREMQPSIEGTMEVGWALMPSAHGKGYATEALTAIIGWGEQSFPGRPMTCIISPENAPSLRVAEKLGFTEKARTDYNGPIIQLSR